MGHSISSNTDTVHSVPPLYLFAAIGSHSDSLFIIHVQLPGLEDPIPTLIDSGATSNFIDSAFSSRPGFACTPLATPIALCLFDGKPGTSGFIHEYITTNLTFSDSSSQDILLLITELHPSASIVLGLPWLRFTKPIIDWGSLSITFPLGTASILPLMTVAMACTMISPPTIFDSIPELHTASMPSPPSVPGSCVSPPFSGYLPNAAIGPHPYVPVLQPDVSSSPPIPNPPSWEQMFDVDGEPLLFSQDASENHSIESSKPLLPIPSSTPVAETTIDNEFAHPKTSPSVSHPCTPLVGPTSNSTLPFPDSPPV
jgi:hypothetical protein